MKHIYMTLVALFATAAITVQAQNTANGHEYVDLGLPSGTLWATCNVGAETPGDYGGYYAWGEKETKTDYTWKTYKWCNGSDTTLTKYCNESNVGTVDNKTILDPEDDVAHVEWGGGWRMPTFEEMTELTVNCDWDLKYQNGRDVMVATSPTTGNSIIFPLAGLLSGTSVQSSPYGWYWSSSLVSSSSRNARALQITSMGRDDSRRVGRQYGLNIRPVISNTATGIIDNEQLSINNSAGALRYNLAGQRVGNDYKGIVIVNGKKQMVK